MNKKDLLISITILSVIICIVVIAKEKPAKTEIPAVKKVYWQDDLVKPEQQWIDKYGYSDESVLAYNIRRLYAVCQQQDKQIRELQQWVLAQPQWIFADMNEPRFKLEKKGLKEPILEVGKWPKAEEK